jgi:hypothetical protein
LHRRLAADRSPLTGPHPDTGGVSHREIILVDVDEVLFPFATAYQAWLHDDHGITLDYTGRTYDGLFWTYDWHEGLVTDFLNSSTMQDTAPLTVAHAATVLLAEQYDLRVCTARGEATQGDATRAWVQRWLPHLGECLFTRQQVGDPGTVTKRSIARAHHAVALLDDLPRYLAEDQEPDGCTGFLIARPAGIPSEPGALTWDIVLSALLPARLPGTPATSATRVPAGWDKRPERSRAIRAG